MYDYQAQKKNIFTEDGSLMFTQIRDNVKRLLNISGAFMMQNAISGVCTGDSWTMLACIDRLVELGEIRELSQNCAGQHRVFISA